LVGLSARADQFGQISSDGGLLVMRALDDTRGLSDLTSAARRKTLCGKISVHPLDGLKDIMPDMNSSVSPTHGDHEGAAWNRHVDCTCYHPNVLFNQLGILERCALRNGNVHSADGWRAVLEPIIARYAGRKVGGRFCRADAAYAIPAIYERLEEAGYFYAIPLPTNTVLKEKIAHRLMWPMGRPSKTKVKRYHEDVQCQAASLDKERSVIAKIEWHPVERFPRVGFIVTNLPMDPDWIVQFYNPRGTAEQHIKEGKQAFRWIRLSCQRFRDNELRLQLRALAFTFGLRPALHCAARGSDRLLAEQPPTQADQDRGPYLASRPRHLLPAGRGRGHGADGARHVCGDPPTASASIIHVAAIPHQTKRKRQDSAVRSAEQRGRGRRKMPFHDPICPDRLPRTAVATITSKRRLTLSGDFQFSRQATRGICPPASNNQNTSWKLMDKRVSFQPGMSSM
jgi:hypothetical protein